MNNRKGLIAFIVAIVIVLGGGIVYATHRSSQPATQATSTSQMKRVGILQFLTHPALDQIHHGVVAGLKKEGYVEGKNLKIDYQNGQGDQSNLKTMAGSFVSNKDDLMVGIATPAAQALANASSTTPVIMGAVTDPVGAGLIKDVNHPGGNITGISGQSSLNKQLDLLKQISPKAKKIGVIYTSSDDSSTHQVKQLAPIAKKLGLTLKKYSISNSNDLDQVSAEMVQNVDAVYVPNDNTIASSMGTLVKNANKVKVPVYPAADTMVKDGGLATYGSDEFDFGYQAGLMAGRILKGEADPATTPVKFITGGKVDINTAVAKKLGIHFPQAVLDEAKQHGEIFNK